MNTDRTNKSVTDAFSDAGLEERIIGVIINFPKMADRICELLTPDMFSDSKTRLVFSVACSLVHEGKTPDLTGLLREIKFHDDAFDDLTLIGYTQLVSSAAIWEQWALALQSLYFKRRLYIGLTEETGHLKSYDRDAFECMDSISALLDEVEKQALRNATGKELPEILDAVEQRVLRRMECKAKGAMLGINTGLNAFNSYLLGWQPSTLNILAARPAMGKTAMMLHFAKTAAIYGSHALIFSLEMSDVSLAQRLVLSECELSPDAVKSGNLTQEQFQQFLVAKNRVSALPVTIEERSGVEIDDLCRIAKNRHRQHKCDIVFVDYLQLITVSRTKNRVGNREQEVAYISRRLKGLSKDLDIPVVALAQLSRSLESRENKRPIMSDLRESGSIEQDADTVVFIYRDEYYATEKNPAIPGQGELIVAKNREGETGTAVFSYNPSLTKIKNLQGIPVLSGIVNSVDIKSIPDECPF